MRLFAFGQKRNDKSKWLTKAGYDLSDWQILEQDLRTQILPLDALHVEETEYGELFEISGVLAGPNGRILKVRTIWIIERESQSTKFITMFPDQN